MTAESFLHHNAPALLMAGSALGWYIASFFAGEALAGDRASPRARALGHWMPIAIFALLATLTKQADIAVGVLFATSVASISLVMGVVAVTMESRSARAGGFPVVESDHSPHAPPFAMPTLETASVDRRMWGFVLPAALLALIAGFRGQLQPLHGVALLIQGLVVLLIWREMREPSSNVQPPDNSRRIIELMLAIALSILTAWAALRATRDVSDRIGISSALPVTSWMVAPALILPMIGSGMHIARRWNYAAVVSTSVGVAILNLCVALPMVIAVWHLRADLPASIQSISPIRQVVATTAPATQSIDPTTQESLNPPLPFPISVWRIDTVILVLLGLMLLPMSFGRWHPGRADGVILVFVYLAYMWLTALIGRG